MRFDVVTLFPEMFDSFLASGLTDRAIAGGLVEVRLTTPRDFTTDRHRTVDDAPYGGGSGMVMMVPPIAAALDRIDVDAGSRAHRVLLSPQGRPFRQADAVRLAQRPAVALVCGRYEGFDERVRSVVDEEISLGDFVLLGGEVAAMAVIEACARLIPGVLGNQASLVEESHGAGVLEYPQYTRPLEFRGMTVPDVLRSGHHGRVARWRRKEALRRTRDRRPDLFAALEPTDLDVELIAELSEEA